MHNRPLNAVIWLPLAEAKAGTKVLCTSFLLLGSCMFLGSRMPVPRVIMGYYAQSRIYFHFHYMQMNVRTAFRIEIQKYTRFIIHLLLFHLTDLSKAHVNVQTISGQNHGRIGL